MVDRASIGVRGVDIERFVGADIVLHESVKSKSGAARREVELT